ncbi:hypothetical protein ABC565_01290 [Mycoplasmopsis synoviae]|uniref:hypothetical protein n=1 Tax=Mycoplasmopsis synoviae TaxID=2109 RepID=UPI00356A16FA
MQKYIKWNLIKYFNSISISLIGSEAFKLASSFYIFKITGSFWLVTILYLLIQLPYIIIYSFSNKLIKILKDKNAHVLCDISSAIFLGIVFGISFWYLQEELFSVVLITLSTILGTIHAYRFIHLKNVLYYITSNYDNLKKFNIANSIALSVGFVLSPIFSFYLYNYLQFYWMIAFT